MKIQYLLNEAGTKYVEYVLNLEAKELVFKLIEEKLTLQTDKLDVREILSMVSKNNPRVELAKKEKQWTFYLVRLDAFGKEYRQSLVIETKETLFPLRVQLINDGTKDITLKNYSVHSLDDYSPNEPSPPKEDE